MVLIREATEVDAHQLASVHVASWRDAYRGMLPDAYLDALTAEDRVDWWRTRLADPPPRSLLLVAEDADGRIAGFSSALVHEHLGPGWALLPQIYLAPSAWGQGIGRALLTEMLTRLGQSGFQDVELWVHPANDRARRFYEAQGWVSDGTEEVESVWGVDLPGIRYTRSTGDPLAGSGEA